MTYAVIYKRGPDEEGRETWSAWVPDLPGCVCAGQTRDECEALISEAIEFHIESLREEGLPVPAPTSVAANVEIRRHKRS